MIKAISIHQYNPGLNLDSKPNVGCVPWFSTLLQEISFPGSISPSFSLQVTSLVVLHNLGSQMVKQLPMHANITK